MNNTYGTHVLLESARIYGKVRRFINVSTDEVRRQPVPFGLYLDFRLGEGLVPPITPLQHL